MKSQLFSLDKINGIITGGAGFLGFQHAKAIAKAGGSPILWDIDDNAGMKCCQWLYREYAVDASYFNVDVTDQKAVEKGLERVLLKYSSVDFLINNAAIDPKVNNGLSPLETRVENLPLKNWYNEIDVGLTGAFICTRVVGKQMIKRGGGSIINIASDLSIIAPDQRIYQIEGASRDEQPVKPVTYSVIKHALVGLTKYFATYWAKEGVRVNSLSPGGVYGNEPQDFVDKLTNLIPMGKMAEYGEYEGAIVFLCSKASKYMTGHNLVMDGGRSVW